MIEGITLYITWNDVEVIDGGGITHLSLEKVGKQNVQTLLHGAWPSMLGKGAQTHTGGLIFWESGLEALIFLTTMIFLDLAIGISMRPFDVERRAVFAQSNMTAH